MEFNWGGNYKERLSALLDTEFGSDLTLLIGQGRQVIKAHKLILSIGSPVLYAKIQSLEEGQEEITFPDAETSVFIRLLKYLYSGEIQISSYFEALEVFHLASDLEISELISQCVVILKENFALDNVLMIFRKAMLSCHRDLIRSTLTFICRNAQSVLEQEEFANLPLDCLIEIIQQDDLEVIREINVFQAAYRWGTAECHRTGAEPLDPPQMRSVMEKVLKWIRFPLMDQGEFALHVATKNLHQTDELVALLVYFGVPAEQRGSLPEGRYSSVPRRFITQEELEQRRSQQASHSSGSGGNPQLQQLFRPHPNLPPVQQEMINTLFGQMKVQSSNN